jgi:integrase/recombinase XerD
MPSSGWSPATNEAPKSAARCPSIKRKRVTPHVLRHTAAMQLLRHGIDRSDIALWLGHESVETTQIYLHADLRHKEEALAKVTPLDMPQGRFQPEDELLAFLEGL